jgi:hypothetical protein
MKGLQMDEFSGFMVFLVTCLLLGGIYLSIQSIVDAFLLPVVERIFRKKQPPVREQELEIAPDTPAKTIVPKEEIIIPQYSEYKHAAQQKAQEEQVRLLDNVLRYTGQELALYVEENEMKKLYEYICPFQYATEKECYKITPPIIIDSKLRPIDLMHFGWNIGNQFKKSGIEIATFIKQVFAKTLKGYEISTLQRKLRAEGNCIIKNKEEL